MLPDQHMSIRLSWRTLASGLLLALSLLASAQSLLPRVVLNDYPGLTLLGAGRMTWFGLPIYHATLWGSEAIFDPRRLYALEIRYDHSFSAERVINTTLDEMRRLDKVTPAQQTSWAAAMRRVFRDIQAGDTLIGVALPGQGTRFYSATSALGVIDDPGFTEAFFAIWLDVRTRQPALRASLLGKP